MFKRGLWLVLLVLLATLVNAELMVNENKYLGVRVGIDDVDTWGDDPDCYDGRQEISIQGSTCGGFYRSSPDVSGCDFSDVPPSQGCWVFAVELDGENCGEDPEDADDDNCGEANVVETTIIKATYTPDTFSHYYNRNEVSGSDDDNEYACAFNDFDDGGIPNFKSGDGKEYLCADDHYWHQCSAENGAEDAPGDLNTTTWANQRIYQCLLDETTKLPQWKQLPGLDADGDGYTTQTNDCDDDSSQNPAVCNELESPEGCKSDAVKYASCSQCINPSVVEVCGDGVDNDCNTETSDDCHKNQYGCEQSEELDTEGNKIKSSQFNVQNKQFSWINTPSGGYCCGFSGESDLGKIEGNDICINKNMVGSQEVLDESSPLWGPENAKCDEWCWVKATGDARFRIFTLRKPDQQPFDVMSDSQTWHDCSDQSKGILSVENPFVEEKEILNRFYCYREGQHWSWAECAGPFDKRKNKNVKGRYAGDGLYSLYLSEADDNGIVDGRSKASISLNPSKGSYPDFYQTKEDQPVYFDFSGYDQLEFFVAFIDESGNEFSAATANKPADLRLKIYGPGETPSLLFDRRVLGDVINGKFFDGWMHVRVPLPASLAQVSGVDIVASPGKNKIKVRNVFLSKKSESSFLCSGQDDSSRSSWLTSFDDDDSASYVNGKAMCIAHYGENAWLGDEKTVTKETASCCGNDEAEYYAGPSENGYGCWNSQPIAAGTTTMNVEYTVGDALFTRSCSQEECLYALSGDPPYTITNLHPELYDLYGITDKKEFLITSQEITEYANLAVRRVAQQVMYNDQEFHGCQAASYVETHAASQPYCTVQGEKFCAASTTLEGKEGKYSVINSWSNEKLTQVGYQPVTGPDFKLELKDLEVIPGERNHSTLALPGRNIISNAEFVVEQEKLPFWHLSKGNEEITKDVKKHLTGNTFTVDTDETLRSERIAIGQNLTYGFQHDGQAKVKITLVDKDGTASVVNNQFTSGTNIFAVIEFSPGTVQQPFLYAAYGTPTYNYEGPTTRSGASCCPDNFCWNGFACAEDMSANTNIFEELPDKTRFRCIKGEWRYLPLKYDWKGEKSGFCEIESQCFVLASSEGGDAAAKAADAYQSKGTFPTCINDREYIFDHYCDQGNWTSRTKFIAQSLLSSIGENEHIIYCAPYKQAFVEYGFDEKYIAGSLPAVSSQLPLLGETLSGGSATKTINTCFNTPSSLVPAEENTCINAVCVAAYKKGGQTRKILATSLNKATDDADSFLKALDLQPAKLNELCPGEKLFNKCSGNIGENSGEIWYSEKLQGLAYSEESFDLVDPFQASAGFAGFFQSFLAFWNDFLGIEKPIKEQEFLMQAANAHKFYLLKWGDKKVLAVQQTVEGGKERIAAEYQGFTTPLCDYADQRERPIQPELLEEVTTGKEYQCSSDASKQRFATDENAEFWWPQLTGSLRVGNK
ncbi:hypothetical protein HYX14_03005 [Candidatus Woesearchaeota archaeon]|nr:hypothetical protein [Candidatus Woesearchaeota archaeon]